MKNLNIKNISNYPDKKFIDTINVNEWEVETEDGWKDIQSIGKTIKYEVWKLVLENDFTLKGADNHIVIKFENGLLTETFLEDLKKSDYVFTKYGFIKVKSIENLNYKENMYDMEINSKNHTYYSNDILSHNSLWMQNLAAKSVKNGYNTAYVTLELQEELVNMRIGSNMLNIDINEYENVSEDTAYMKDKINKLKNGQPNQLGKLYVKEFPSSTMSANDLYTHLRKAEEILGYKFQNVFIDYVNIMKNWRNPNTENTYIKIKQISEDLRASAQEGDWTFITVTQTGRCLSPNTIVHSREKGKVELKHVNEGDYILGDKEGYKQIKNIFNSKNVKTYKIKTKSGKEIITSASHTFPVNNSLKQVSDIKIGDKLYIKK